MSVRDAVIVSTARTPIGRAYQGRVQRHARRRRSAHLSLAPAIERAGIEPARSTTSSGARSLHPGHAGGNIGRQVALRAGCPVTVAGMTIDRQCASGLMAIATAAKQVIVDRMDIVAAGGQDSISLVQTPEMRLGADPSLIAMHKDVYMPMLGTAETVAQRYKISRERAGRICAAVAAAHRRRAGRRAFRRRDRPRDRDDGRQGQGNRRGLAKGGHALQGRGQSRRHDARGPGLAAAGARPGHEHHRRQCQPAQRRRRRPA